MTTDQLTTGQLTTDPGTSEPPITVDVHLDQSAWANHLAEGQFQKLALAEVQFPGRWPWTNNLAEPWANNLSPQPGPATWHWPSIMRNAFRWS